MQKIERDDQVRVLVSAKEKEELIEKAAFFGMRSGQFLRMLGKLYVVEEGDPSAKTSAFSDRPVYGNMGDRD